MVGLEAEGAAGFVLVLFRDGEGRTFGFRHLACFHGGWETVGEYITVVFLQPFCAGVALLYE